MGHNSIPFGEADPTILTPIYLVANHTFCIDPVKCIYFVLITTFMLFCSQHYGSILWQTLGKNPILVDYVVLGIGYGVSAHDLSGYKVLGVLVVDNGPHVKEPLTALLKPIPKS